MTSNSHVHDQPSGASAPTQPTAQTSSILASLIEELRSPPGIDNFVVCRTANFPVGHAPALGQEILTLQDGLFQRIFNPLNPLTAPPDNRWHGLPKSYLCQYFRARSGHNIRIYNGGPLGLRLRYCKLMETQPHRCDDPRGCLSGESNWFSFNIAFTSGLPWVLWGRIHSQGFYATLDRDDLAQERALEEIRPLTMEDTTHLKERCYDCSYQILQGGDPALYPCIKVQGPDGPACGRCVCDGTQLGCWVPGRQIGPAEQDDTNSEDGDDSDQEEEDEDVNDDDIEGPSPKNPFDPVPTWNLQKIVRTNPDKYLKHGTLVRLVDGERVKDKHIAEECIRLLPSNHAFLRVPPGSDTFETVYANIRQRLATGRRKQKDYETEADRLGHARRCDRCKKLCLNCTIREASKDGDYLLGDNCDACEAAEEDCEFKAENQEWNEEKKADMEGLFRRCQRCKNNKQSCSIREMSKEEEFEYEEDMDCNECVAAGFECDFLEEDHNWNVRRYNGE